MSTILVGLFSAAGTLVVRVGTGDRVKSYTKRMWVHTSAKGQHVGRPSVGEGDFQVVDGPASCDLGLVQQG